MTSKTFQKYKKVQSIAKNVLSQLPSFLTSESTEYSIVNICKDLLLSYGISNTWYYDCPALVLLGERSCLSISGRDYNPDKTMQVGNQNLVTVDLSPVLSNYWGDCARSFIIEDRAVQIAHSEEFRVGMDFQIVLHSHLVKTATKDTTFSQLYEEMNSFVIENGFENLDLHKNLGHSIEQNLQDRVYIEEENSLKLGSVDLFTFEPHIRMSDSNWGFKHENIYFFDGEGRLREL